ncbi:ribokinase [Comamonas aquatilis]|uniref:ribokinase n=1 Tax=Comamonas aquatilis TaxID=1778406 RepID=UPI0039EEE8B4
MTSSHPMNATTTSSPALKTARVAVVGSLNMDVVLTLARVPAAGETVAADDLNYLPGGKGGNQAVACARHGAQVSLFGSVGADHHGQTLKSALQADGVNVEHVSEHAGVPTGTAVIMVEPDGQNRICVVPGANAGLVLPEAALLAVLAQSDYLVLQFETPVAVVQQALQTAQKAGCPVVLNPSPVREVPDAWWPWIHTLVVNEHEAAAFTAMPIESPQAAEQAARALLARGVQQVVVTLGAQGAVAVAQGAASFHPAPVVSVVDTTAAGDTFLGAMVTRLAEGSALADAVPWGIRAASLCIGKAGAQPSIPTREQVQA